MDTSKTHTFVDEKFDAEFVEPLKKFIEIPNLSPFFDQEFHTNGLIQEAAEFVIEYAEKLNIEGLTHKFY